MTGSRRPYAPRLSAEDRRTQLLDAALTVIDRDGYAAVTIEAIAREAGVTRPVVYGAFEGRTALLFALLDRTERRALEQLLAAISVEPDPDDLEGFAERTVRQLVAMVAADPRTWRPILLAPEGTPADVRTRVDRDRDVVRSRIQAIVEGLAAARGAAGSVDAEIAAHAIVAIAEHFGRVLLAEPERFDAERLATAVSGLVRLGLR